MPEYLDRLQLLEKCRDLISEAQSRGLPIGHYREEQARLINALLELQIIDRHSPASMMLSPKFLATLDKIVPGRNFGDFSQVEIERVALALTA
jgi:hypothetical protein